MIFAIDPGPTQSAFCVIDGDYRPVMFAKVDNGTLQYVWLTGGHQYVIEMVGAYGMPVGAEVFETCVWIGRFVQRIRDLTGGMPALVKRLPVRLHHCHSTKAKDANVTQALVDRFAPGVSNHGKGTKSAPGWFYGFKADVWQAYALAVYEQDCALAGTVAGEPFGVGVTGRPGVSEGLQTISGGAR